MADKVVNLNLYALLENHEADDRKPIVCLEGATRSGKTWSWLEYAINCGESMPGVVMSAFRHDASTHDKAAVRDFKSIMAQSYMEIWKAGKFNNQLKTFTFKNGSILEFVGTNDPSKLHGPERDIAFLNEVMEITYEAYRQIMSRTRLLVIMDWNPSLNVHWVFDRVLSREDVLYVHSTYLDNPHLSAKQVAEIEGTNPEIAENIRQGTADQWYWDVYGLGKRGRREGAIFRIYDVIDYWPEPHLCDKWGYGLDFGFSDDPAALVECCIHQGNLLLREHVYQTGLITIRSHAEPNTPSLQNELEQLGISKNAKIKADQSRPDQIAELRTEGYNISATPKTKNSIVGGIDLMKRFPIRVHRSSPNMQMELQQYAWKKHASGLALNEPEDKWNHCFVDGTMVATNRGQVAIELLRDDDLILTRNGYKPMRWHGKTRVAEVSCVKFSNGSVLYGHKDHKIHTFRGKIPIDELRYCDIVYPLESNGDKLWKASHFKGENITDSLTLIITRIGVILSAWGDCITETFGKALTGRSQTDTQFITSTSIQPTTQLITCSALPQKNMDFCTVEGVLINNAPTSTVSGHSQRNGTQVKRAGSGIANMARGVQRTARCWISGARSVVTRSSRSNLSQGSVQTSARARTGSKAELITSNATASNADQSSQSTNTTRRGLAHVSAVAKPQTGQRQLYNLEVDGLHEYYANGILVSNCIDAARYWALDELVRWQPARPGKRRGMARATARRKIY